MLNSIIISNTNMWYSVWNMWNTLYESDYIDNHPWTVTDTIVTVLIIVLILLFFYFYL